MRLTAFSNTVTAEAHSEPHHVQHQDDLKNLDGKTAADKPYVSDNKHVNINTTGCHDDYFDGRDYGLE